MPCASRYWLRRSGFRNSSSRISPGWVGMRVAHGAAPSDGSRRSPHRVAHAAARRSRSETARRFACCAEVPSQRLRAIPGEERAGPESDAQRNRACRASGRRPLRWRAAHVALDEQRLGVAAPERTNHGKNNQRRQLRNPIDPAPTRKSAAVRINSCSGPTLRIRGADASAIPCGKIRDCPSVSNRRIRSHDHPPLDPRRRADRRRHRRHRAAGAAGHDPRVRGHRACGMDRRFPAHPGVARRRVRCTDRARVGGRLLRGDRRREVGRRAGWR